MSDDRTGIATDLKWIDVHDDGEVWYWTHKFGVTKRKLVALVREVGAHAELWLQSLTRARPLKISANKPRSKTVALGQCRSHSNVGQQKPPSFRPRVDRPQN